MHVSSITQINLFLLFGAVPGIDTRAFTGGTLPAAYYSLRQDLSDLLNCQNWA